MFQKLIQIAESNQSYTGGPFNCPKQKVQGGRWKFRSSIDAVNFVSEVSQEFPSARCEQMATRIDEGGQFTTSIQVSL